MDELKKSLRQSDDKDPFVIEETKEDKERIQVDRKDQADRNRNEKNMFSRFKTWFSNLSKKKRIAFIGGIFVGSVLFIYIVALIFKLDSLFFPSSIEGVVYNQESEAIEGASVCIDGSCVLTEVNGSYIIGNLKYGDYILKVEAEHYREYEEALSLGRGRMTYDVRLEPSGYGNLKAELVVDDEEYDFSEMEVYINDERIDINEDGLILVENLPEGEYTLKIISPDFKDQEISIDIEDGENDIGNIELEAAGDISINLVDWINNSNIENATLKIGEEKHTSSEDGKVDIYDIDINDKVEMVGIKEGYHEKEILVDIQQGENEPKEINMVKVGKVVYVSSRMGNKNIYISNYDGSSERMLSDNQGDSYSPLLMSDGSTVKFLSTREKAKDTFGYVVPLVYSVSVNGGPITKISKNQYEDNDGYLGSYDFESGKRAYIRYHYDGSYHEMYVSNIDGTGVKKLMEFSSGWIGANLISSDGSFIVYSINGSEDPNLENGVYYIDTTSGNTILLYELGETSAYPMDISSDRKSVLIKVYDKDSSKWDLWVVGTFDKTKYQVTNTTADEELARFTPEGSRVSYITRRDNKSDVYLVDINGENEKKVTSDGEVDDYFWGQDGLIFYNSDMKMWVKDSNSKAKGKKVTENVLQTYFSSHYYYESYYD